MPCGPLSAVGGPATPPHKMVKTLCSSFLLLPALPLFFFLFPFLPAAEGSGVSPPRLEKPHHAAPSASSSAPAKTPSPSPPQEESSICFSAPALDAELRRLCMMVVDHLPALYRRLSAQYEVTSPLTPEEVLAAIAEFKQSILDEEDAIAELVLTRKLPHGALPVYSLKTAIQKKLTELNKLKEKNITTLPGLMGLQLRGGKVVGVNKCVEAQVMFFYDLIGQKFSLSRMSEAEVYELGEKVQEALSADLLKENDLPAVLEFISRAVLDAVAAPSRAASLGAALQAMPPFAPVGEDNGLTPLTFPRCLTLVRGLFPSLRAHMTLHYNVKEPNEEQLAAMAAVLLPIVNAHRSRLRLSSQKGVTLLAPDETFLLWWYMEIYADRKSVV